MFKYTHHQQELCGYQYKINGEVYPIVNAVTKAWIKDRYLSVVLVINYAAVIDENLKIYILLSPFRL